MRVDTKRRNKLGVCLLISIVFFFICHGFMMMNPSYSHDSLVEFVRADDHSQIMLGRFGQIIWRELFGRVTATWFIGVVASVLLGFSIYFLSEILSFKQNITIILTAGILTTNYTVSNSVATYMPWVDIYSGALLLSLLSVYIVKKYRWGLCIGALFVTGSLSLYQPYVLCIPIVVVCYILKNYKKKECWKFILKNIAMLGLGYLIYRFLLWLILKRTGLVLFDGYNSIKHIGIPNAIITNLWQEITGTYITSFDNLFATLNTIPGSKILISFFIGFWFLVMIVYQQKRLTDLKRWGIISYYCAVVLLPIVANIQYIVSKTAYHVLMLYSIHFLMIIPVVFLEKTYDDTETDCLDNRHNVSGIGIRNRFEGRVGYVVRMGTYGLVIIAIFLNIRYANNVYTEKYMRERSTLSLMTRIMSRAEETEGYIPGEMPIIIVGEIGNNISVGEKNPAYFGTQIGDASKFISITYDINSYLRYYLGYDTLEDDYYLKDNVNVINMPAFPEKGFAKILDGKLIIKVASNN